MVRIIDQMLVSQEQLNPASDIKRNDVRMTMAVAGHAVQRRNCYKICSYS